MECGGISRIEWHERIGRDIGRNQALLFSEAIRDIHIMM
jgi:hypothetical protein